VGVGHSNLIFFWGGGPDTQDTHSDCAS